MKQRRELKRDKNNNNNIKKNKKIKQTNWSSPPLKIEDIDSEKYNWYSIIIRKDKVH